MLMGFYKVRSGFCHRSNSTAESATVSSHLYVTITFHIWLQFLSKAANVVKNYGTKIWGWGSNCDLAPPPPNFQYALRALNKYCTVQAKSVSLNQLELQKRGEL